MAETNDFGELLSRATAGDSEALAQLFARYRDRLRQMVRLRLDRRLQGNVDPSDVLKEAFGDFSRRLPEFAQQSKTPFYLWLRSLTGQKLMEIHRSHFGTKIPDEAQEVSLYRGALPEASSVSLAAQLLGRLTSASQAAIRAETQLRVQEALNSMDPVDREILTLRHFEMLSNEEAATVLGLKCSSASNRYLRALKRLKEIVGGLPDRGANS